jgi:hypothetical protein
LEGLLSLGAYGELEFGARIALCLPSITNESDEESS